jgi:L-lactate dehydrogenase
MTKVSIVGAGAVGTAIAYAAQIRGVSRRLSLFDLNARKVRAEVLDLNHGMQFTPMAEITGSDDLAVCADADVIVITAGAKQDPGQTRLDLAGANVAMCRELVPALVSLAPDALLLLVTNPVDVVTMAAQEFSGLPPHRVFGSGTVLDSSRLRFLIAEHARVAVQNVHAYIAGEHGDSEVPLWSTATIGGVPVTDWTSPDASPLDADARARIHERVVSAAYEIIAGKGATSLAIGLAVSRILEAVLNDEHRVLPVTSRLDGVHGLSDVCLSMPSVVGRAGIESVLATPLSADELDRLTASADAVRTTARSLGL